MKATPKKLVVWDDKTIHFEGFDNKKEAIEWAIASMLGGRKVTVEDGSFDFLGFTIVRGHGETE